VIFRSLCVVGASALVLVTRPVAAVQPAPCEAGRVYESAPAPGTHTADTDASGALTVASLNIKGRSLIAEAVAAWINRRDVDVLLLQEVGGAEEDGGSFTAALGARLGFASAFARARPVGDTGNTHGLAIVSRYPLDDAAVRSLPYYPLRFRAGCRVAVAATVRTPSGPVRVVNVHLDTRINSARRLAQLEASMAAINGFTGPRIVGGDFNTNDFRWINSTWPLPFAEQQTKAVRERMSAGGYATPFGDTRGTYPLLAGLALKLDWLFLSSDLEAGGVGVDDLPLTDHRGIWARASSAARR
jgi:endonuclease/exonuclease/phosphatase family metal-dependent hydrolase